MNELFSRILVVDDRPANLVAMKKMLHLLPAEVLVASSGVEALRMTLEHDLAVVLLDVDMPGMDGYEVAEMLKAVKETRQIPIIFLTAAFKDQLHRLRAYQAGGVDYLEKPVDDVILLSKVGVFLELHKMRRSQELTLARLQQSEAKFRAMVDHVGVGMVIADPVHMRIIEANQAFAHMLGFDSPEALQGVAVAEISDPEEMITHVALIRQLMARTIPSFQVEKRYVGRGGRVVWGRVTVTRVPQTPTDPACMVAAVEDVTARRVAEEALSRESARHQMLLRTASDGIHILNMQGDVVEVNDAFCTMLGYDRSEALTLNVARWDAQWDAAELRARIQSLAHQPAIFETRHRRRDGHILDVEINAQGFEADGQWFVFASARDVSERKRLEESMRRAKVAAEAANLAKSEFLANMSHEIRTPLNAILGMGELLWEQDLNETQRRYVQIFRGAGEVLLSVINDVLDMAKIEAGELTLERIPFNLWELVETTTEIIALRAHSKGLELAFHTAAEVPEHVIGDPLRISQVLLNLLGNAVKFTERGDIFLSVALHRETVDGVVLLLTVRDTGIGIPEDKVQSIFSSFSQVDASITRRYGGTGLGLAISRRLVKAMGGELAVHSRQGQGSTFRFTVCVGKVATAPAASSHPHFPGLRVVVTDDTAVNRYILHEALMAVGAEVREADSGQATLEIMTRDRQNGWPCQVLLLDKNMPDMDGFTVVEHLRQWGCSPPVIMMLTSDQRVEDHDRCVDLGIASYLVKPIKRSELYTILHSLLVGEGGSANSEVPGAVSEVPVRGTLNVLVAEDAVDNRLLISAFLGNTAYRVDFAEDGREAVAKFKSGHFDVVLMDMQMPEMDGFSATRVIREWERQQGRKLTPILALTAYALHEDVEKALAAGCDAHLAKPIKKKTLLDALAGYG